MNRCEFERTVFVGQFEHPKSAVTILQNFFISNQKPAEGLFNSPPDPGNFAK